MSGQASAELEPREDRSVQIALAEYSALQSQVGTHITAQYALVGIALTAFGVVAGFAFGQHGDRKLLLIIPPLALMMSLIHGSITYRSLKASIYIRVELLPFLRELSTSALPSWEVFEEAFRRRVTVVAGELLIDGPAIAVFSLASLGAAIFAEHVSVLLRVTACVLTALTVVAPLVAPLLANSLARRAAEIRASRTIESPPSAKGCHDSL